jgi:formylglycine-generating enzyme required for sulfatase activity
MRYDIKRTVNQSQWGVGAAAALLVGATWAALQLAPEARDMDDGSVAFFDASADFRDGFRADLWHLPADDLAGFVAIPEGTFTMGSDPGVDPLAFDVEWWGEGRVQGIVHLATYYVARFEVTGAQYRAFVEATGHAVADRAALQVTPDHPVTNVSWTDAVAYTRWLDEALRASDAVPGPLAQLLEAGWRVDLLDEAQWEKAARGTDGRIFPWGSEPRADRAQFRTRATARVGTFPCPECAYPISDLAGNVWEWTRSPYQPYPFTTSDDAATLGAEALWVMRGGSFGDPEQHIRAANRGGADPGARRPFIGFRVALVRGR